MLIDPADLIDPREVAAIIGMSNPSGVSVYRRRYDDFPAPVVEKGRCLLWRRDEIEAWARATGRIQGAGQAPGGTVVDGDEP